MDLQPSRSIKRVGVLAPCEDVSEFPVYFHGDDARSVLAGWTAAWRPALIATTGQLPRIVSAYDPPNSPWEDSLLIATAPGYAGEAADWVDELRETSTGLVAQDFADRAEAIATIDALLPDLPRVGTEFEAECFALGYAYLQVATLTHELSHGSVFDAGLFERTVVKAARAAVAGERAAFDIAIDSCYDQLLQARNYTYPSDISLVDILLLAESTLDDSFAKELESDTPCNVLLTGQMAEQLSSKSPDSLAALRAAVGAGRVCMLTGAYDGGDVSTVDPEAMLRSIGRSQSTITQLTGTKPQVFAQRKTTIGPRMPQALVALGFTGAVVAGFDGREPPMTSQGRTTWIGLDGVGVEALSATPYDLAASSTILRISELLADTLQRDHAATLLLAGYPGARDPMLEDLRRVARRSEVLGRFVKLDKYLEGEGTADHWGHFDDDAYGPREPSECASCDLLETRDTLCQSLAEIASALGDTPTDREQSAVERLTQLVGGVSGDVPSTTLGVNPWSFQVQNVPAMGFARAGSTQETSPLRAEGTTLRNEGFEATVSPETGGLRSFRSYATRRNQASQRLLISRRRTNNPLTTMHADSVDVVECSDQAGVIRSVGRLVEGRGRTFATFEQTMRLAAHAAGILVELRIEASDALPGGAKHFEVALRTAIGDASWEWHRGLQWARLPVARTRCVAGEYVQANDGVASVSLACQRPTLIRRVGGGQFDAVLPWGASGVACGRFMLCSNHRYPLQTYLGGIGGLVSTEAPFTSTVPPTGWWLHSSSPSVVLSHLEANAAEKFAKIRLIETEGRGARTKLRFCRPIRQAVLQGLNGEQLEPPTLADGAAEIEIGPYGWLQVVASW